MTNETIDLAAAIAARMERYFVVRPTLTLADGAKALGISDDTFRKMLENGDIPYTRVGKMYRVFPEDLNKYLEANTARK